MTIINLPFSFHKATELPKKPLDQPRIYRKSEDPNDEPTDASSFEQRAVLVWIRLVQRPIIGGYISHH